MRGKRLIHSPSDVAITHTSTESSDLSSCTSPPTRHGCEQKKEGRPETERPSASRSAHGADGERRVFVFMTGLLSLRVRSRALARARGTAALPPQWLHDFGEARTRGPRLAPSPTRSEPCDRLRVYVFSQRPSVVRGMPRRATPGRRARLCTVGAHPAQCQALARTRRGESRETLASAGPARGITHVARMPAAVCVDV